MKNEPNPNPNLITEAMWKLWLYCPLKAELSGIYADKKGYHNTVLANLLRWPGNYSTRFPLDLVKYNRDKARAIDLSMDKANMILWTIRMKRSAEDPHDNRLAAVREFYGTLDGKTVFGLIKDDEDGPWRNATADDSHLWHGHMGVFTAFVNNWEKLKPIVSVWAGLSLTEWENDVFLVEKGQSGESVSYWQLMHNACKNLVSPPSPELTVDGDYGPKMAAAVADFCKKRKGDPNFDGSRISPWIAIQYQSTLVSRIFNQQQVTKPVDSAQVKGYVENWLNANISKFGFTGNVKGHISVDSTDSKS